MPFVKLSTCNTFYTDPPVWEGNICAGGQGPEFQDTCYGDSGGPLLVNGQSATAKHTLAGVTSYGYSCGNSFPGVYTNTARLNDWMDDVITLQNMGGNEPPSVGCASRAGQKYNAAGAEEVVAGIKSAGECCNACKVGRVGGLGRCLHWAWHSATGECVLMEALGSRQVAPTWTSGNLTIAE